VSSGGNPEEDVLRELRELDLDEIFEWRAKFFPILYIRTYDVVRGKSKWRVSCERIVIEFSNEGVVLRFSNGDKEVGKPLTLKGRKVVIKGFRIEVVE
jgi:hypothetical protein